MNNHLEACLYCPKSTWYGTCSIYRYADLGWVNRRGGCGMFPYRDLPSGMSYLDGKILYKGRTGQQKQKHTDRTYRSKNDSRTKFRRVVEE